MTISTFLLVIGFFSIFILTVLSAALIVMSRNWKTVTVGTKEHPLKIVTGPAGKRKVSFGRKERNTFVILGGIYLLAVATCEQALVLMLVGAGCALFVGGVLAIRLFIRPNPANAPRITVIDENSAEGILLKLWTSGGKKRRNSSGNSSSSGHRSGSGFTFGGGSSGGGGAGGSW